MIDGVDEEMNFSCVTRRVWLGSRPQTAADIETLIKHSVTHILNVCATADPIQVLDNIFYLWNPTDDDGQPKPVSWFKTSLDFAMPVLARPKSILYVHCYNGIDRSAATVYAILRAWGMTEFESKVMIKTRRPKSLWRYTDNADAAVVEGW